MDVSAREFRGCSRHWGQHRIHGVTGGSRAVHILFLISHGRAVLVLLV